MLVVLHGQTPYTWCMASPTDLTNRRFGRLTAKARAGTSQRGPVWLFQCDCGATIERLTADVLRSRRPSRSCGCLRLENAAGFRHGHASAVHGQSRTYNSWAAAVSRCRNPAIRQFHLYGGRGITICDRWADSFEAFLADMGERPAGRTLDRIDGALGYEPGNCRWATAETQNNNRRTVISIEADGGPISAKAFAREHGVGYTSLLAAMRRGLSAADAVEHLKRTGRRHRGRSSAVEASSSTPMQNR